MEYSVEWTVAGISLHDSIHHTGWKALGLENSNSYIALCAKSGKARLKSLERKLLRFVQNRVGIRLLQSC